ncbi:MAG: alpha/beta fold hydrolase [Deltaproteobacteria bacterium]|nr:alpha/beta fold hydrolase [Deltaproteobacteria bacterium]
MAHRSDVIEVRGVRTRLLKGGRGQPLLVLHPEFGAGLWAPYHDALAARFHVLAPDHPGFGGSERPNWLDHIDDLVFHYIDLLDQLGIERAAIAGCSLGGWIAAAFAIAHPERVERLVLAAPAGVKVDGVPRYDYFANPIEDVLTHLFHDPARAAQILPEEYGAEVVVRGYHELTTLARLSWNPYLYDPKLQQRLPRVRTPTLLLWGAEDAVLPPPHADAWAALLPYATLRLLTACGHLAPFEQADACARHTIEFLSA